MEETEFDFKLTQEEFNTVLTGLGNLPYVKSTAIINKLSKAYADHKNRIEAAKQSLQERQRKGQESK